MQSINIRCNQNISQLSCWLCKCLLLQPFREPHLHMQRSWDAPAANAGLCQHSRADQITTIITDEVKITLTLKMTEFNFKQWTVLLYIFRYFFLNKSFNWNFLTKWINWHCGPKVKEESRRRRWRKAWSDAVQRCGQWWHNKLHFKQTQTQFTAMASAHNFLSSMDRLSASLSSPLGSRTAMEREFDKKFMAGIKSGPALAGGATFSSAQSSSLPKSQSSAFTTNSVGNYRNSDHSQSSKRALHQDSGNTNGKTPSFLTDILFRLWHQQIIQHLL